MTKEHPILFSAPMVRALLAGTKTQTRRACKPAPVADARFAGEHYFPGKHKGAADISVEAPYVGLACPYGAPGDRLWVRESFWGCDLPGYGDQPCVVYDDEWHGKEYHPAQPRPWGRKFGRIPSIHMPRDCSRITLEITGVRVERLHTTWANDADCIAEGIEEMPPHPCGTRLWRNYLPGHPDAWSPRLATPGNSFSTLWRSINGDASWDANPWVWVVEFKRAG